MLFHQGKLNGFQVIERALFCNGKMIIIITLFQEDSRFGTNASLTYDPQLQKKTYH